MRRAARTALRRGATQVKVCVSGGVMSYTDSLEDTQFGVDELRAAVDEAHARRTYVTAHAHTAPGIRNGLAAGIECFEHGTFLDEETVTAMVAAGVALVPLPAFFSDGQIEHVIRDARREMQRGEPVALRAVRVRAGPELGPHRGDDSLLLATWNIRDFDSNRFGHGPRLPESAEGRHGEGPLTE